MTGSQNCIRKQHFFVLKMGVSEEWAVLLEKKRVLSRKLKVNTKCRWGL